MRLHDESVLNGNGSHSNSEPGASHLPVPLHADRVSCHFIRRIPHEFARQHLIVSQIDDQSAVALETLAVSSSSSAFAVLNVATRLQRPIVSFVADDEALARTIDEAYARERPHSLDEDQVATAQNDLDIDRLIDLSDRDLLSTQGKGHIVRFVDAILFEALGREASDVHVQPLVDRTLVRYRLDGVLHTVREIKPSLTPPIVSRIKVMSRMDIAERRVPQDGRSTVNIGQRSIDLRVSTLPTSYGERAVIRLLDNANHLCDFHKLGMPSDVAEAFLEGARRSHGMILLTGPTGSGKTTTLYSTLRTVGSPGLNIMTIEDPIEYELATVGMAISQSQVNPRKGITFATGLRHILRQDPDVVMVGEIRDPETARIAVQASLTGHLVFSTLHTNDSASAVTRLLDLEIENYLVSSSLSAVLAQRLVRVIHAACRGQGCEQCAQTGFRGRTGVFELMVIDETMRDLITQRANLADIRRAATAAGTQNLREAGARLVQAGITTQREVDRVVHGAC